MALHRSHCKIGISGWWLHFREGIRKRAGAKNQDGRCTGDGNIQQLRPQVCPERPVLHARRQFYLHPEGECLHGENGLRGSYWGQRALADYGEAIAYIATQAVTTFWGG